MGQAGCGVVAAVAKRDARHDSGRGRHLDERGHDGEGRPAARHAPSSSACSRPLAPDGPAFQTATWPPFQPTISDVSDRHMAATLKLSVDRDRRPGRFVLTGSANLLVLPTVTESLAGRMEVARQWHRRSATDAWVRVTARARLHQVVPEADPRMRAVVSAVVRHGRAASCLGVAEDCNTMECLV